MNKLSSFFQNRDLGIPFAPVFWGFCAALAEVVGGALLVAGYATRVAALFLFVTMVVATIMLVQAGKPFPAVSNPLHMVFVFLALIFLGGGRFAVGGTGGGDSENR